LADQPPLLRHAPRIARPAPVVVPPVPVANEAPQATIIPAPQANDPSFDHEDLA
ncbi:patatin family protein, partial [Enterobacter cloacae complex sp. 743-2DZ2F-22B]